MFWFKRASSSSSPTIIPAVFVCPRCVFHSNSPTDLATNPVGVSPRWVPTEDVQSGLPIQKKAPTPTPSNATAPVPSPPKVVHMSVRIVDFYNHTSTLDNGTRCSVRMGGGEGAKGAVLENGDTVAVAGVASFPRLLLRAEANSLVLLLVSCQGYQQQVEVNLTVGTCLPGQMLSGTRVCTPCEPGTYSARGLFCFPCPSAGGMVDAPWAVCKRITGTLAPASLAGFYLAAPTASTIRTLSSGGHRCDWLAANDAPTLAYWLSGVEERKEWYKTAKAQLSSLQLLACSAGLQLYPCKLGALSCLGNVSLPPPATTSATPEAVARLQQCGAGYGGALCSVCALGYALNSQGECGPCGSQGSTAERASAGYYILKALLMGSAFLFVIAVYLRPNHLRRQRGQTDPSTLGPAARCWHGFKIMLGIGGGTKLLRPEKLKILLGFSQVAGGVGPPHHPLCVCEFALCVCPVFFHCGCTLWVHCGCSMRRPVAVSGACCVNSQASQPTPKVPRSPCRVYMCARVLLPRQIFNNMVEVYPTVWSTGVQGFMRSLSVVNLDLVQLSGVGCLTSLNFYSKVGDG